MNKSPYLFLACIVGVSLLAGCDDTKVQTELKTPVYNTGLAADELRNSKFMEKFPDQAATYLLNDETEVMTTYKGSIAFRKNDNVNPLPKGNDKAQPYLKNLWLGYPFMYEYNEARGHTYALEDFVEIDRINRYAHNGGLPATCWTCKTPQMVAWVDEYGDDFWSMNVNEFREKIDLRDDTIGCANCHNSETMELQLYSVPLKDWLVRSGQDIDNISRNEMRSLVCAQCHSEYYFQEPGHGASKKPVFPWDNGFNPEDMAQYYMGYGDGQMPGFEGQFTDWVHPASGAPMVKMQHPEYEMWIDGVHGAAGVSCADCHMPYEKANGGKKMSSHWWTSPMKDPKLSACRQCHSDKSPEYLRSRVEDTQEKTFNLLLKAQDVSVKAHEAVRLATLSGTRAANFDQLIIDARAMVRKGQLFWDYVSAENGVGFHNPTKSLATLASSIEYSQKAIDLAMQASNYSIARTLAQDIKTLVPPIVEHSRKLQQDPNHLRSHVWLNLLSPLPKGDLYWHGTEVVK